MNASASISASSPFFTTRADRLQLARRRYFEEGITPVGVVDEAIFHSWARCQRLHSKASDEVAFQPVTASRTHLAMQKSRLLIQAWQAELPELESILSTTSCAAMLTDASGVLIGASCAGRSHEELMPVATRLGVDLSEEAVGTTAPGIVVRTGQPHAVLGGEHFFEGVKAMNCAAAPIRDVHGKVAGVLDLSSEAFPFGFDAASVVGLFAGALENRLLMAQSQDHLVLRLQVSPALLDSSMVGLLGIDGRGQLVWSNGVAAKLLGLSSVELSESPMSAEAALATPITSLLALPRSGGHTLRLRNGLQVWARAEITARDGLKNVHPSGLGEACGFQCLESPEGACPEEGRSPQKHSPLTDSTTGPVEPDTPAAVQRQEPDIQTLRASDRDIIRRTVEECGGNIAKAAKLLQVSRGLIYRRLREARTSCH
jgi:sigma-54 dependent transcriptional regulator, acetoin dehydrogenase operon transcriptional activator AcoR